MNSKQYFKGSIVIGDPSYFITSDDDWELSEYGKCLSKLGFSDYMLIDFPNDPQVVVSSKTNEIIGGICQDSGVVVVVYKNELESYNPDYERSFFSKKNRTIVNNFEGKIEYKKVPIVINGYEDTNTIISGQGNNSFKSCYEDDLI